MSHDDDEDTERGHRRARQLWGDTRRAAVGSGHRRHAQVMAAVEDREREPITDTFQLVEREEMSQTEIEIVRRSKRDSDDPATFRDIVKLAVLAQRREDSERTVAKEAERQVVEAIDGQAQHVTGLRNDMRLIKWVAGVVGTVILGLAGWSVERIWSSAERVGEMTIRLQHVEEAVNRQYQELRDITSRKDNKQ